MQPLSKPNQTIAQTVPLTVIAGDNNQRIYQLGPDPKRIGLVLKCTGAGGINVAFGQEATANYGYAMASTDAPLVFNQPDSCPKQFITFYALATSAISFISTSEV